jgi:hypothetical protein
MLSSLTPSLAPATLLVLLAGSTAAFQDTESEAWTWRVAPYLWTTAIDGTLETRNAEADFDVDFSDIWNNLESAALLLVETRRDQLTILGDLIYLGLDVDGETPLGADADLQMDTTILELAGLVRLTPDSPFELGAGVRYAYIDTELDAGPVESDGSRDVFDGFAAGRATWSFARRWSMTVYGDVGTGQSDLTWQGSAMLGYHFEGWGLGLGYRILDYEIEDGSDELDLAFEGLLYGVEFRF